MGNTLEFPFNNEMYFEKTIDYIENQEFEQALHCIEKVYATDKSAEINHLFTLILYTLDRVEEALDIADEQKDFYLQEEKNTVFYTMILIKNHSFIEAEVLVQNHLSNEHSPYFMEWKNAHRELVLEKESVQFQVELQKKEALKGLQDIESYSGLKQVKAIKKARILELKELQNVAQTILFSPNVSTYNQKAFLELLIERKDSNEYIIQWLDGPRKIIPKDLKTFDQLPILDKLIEHIEEKLAKHPSSIDLIKTEMINDLLVLYPFIEEVIEDVDYWVNTYIDSFGLFNQEHIQKIPAAEEQKKMDKWLELLNQMAQRNLDKM